jgi:hypothetical protein
MVHPAPGPPRSFVRRVLSVENLAGDVRSALIGSGTGAVIAIIAAGAATLWLTKPLDYTVFVNEDGFGQPRPLFDLAEKADPKLRLEFSPTELRSVYVCEFKRVTGPNYKALVLQYLDTYRDCFDVSERGDNEFRIFANTRSARLQLNKGSFLCKCNAASTK